MMAVELFDPSQIDSAVGDAFGTKVKSRPVPAAAPVVAPAPSAPANQATLISDQLLDRLKKVESGKDPYAVNKETKAMGPYQFLPETVQMLHKQGVKFNPFDEKESREAARTYLTQLTNRHGGNVDLALKDYGGFVTKDPTNYIQKVTGGTSTAPASAQSSSPSSASTTEFSGIKEQDINSAVNDAFKNPEPPKPGVVEKTTGKVASKVGEFFRGQGRAAASLADTGINALTGTLDVLAYPVARAYYGTQMSPEAAAEKAKAETTSPKNVVGRAFGVTETPQYKGEASQQLMNYIGANMDKGADVIAKETGLPKADVESYMNTVLLATPSALKAAGQTKLGQVIKTEAGYAGQAVKQGVQAVTPEIVQRGVVRAAEAVAPGVTGVKAPSTTPGAVPTVAGQPPQAAPYAQPGGGRAASVGAAATPDATIIKQALQTATPEFQQLYGNMPLDKVNAPVVLRHLEGDSLPVPVRLTEGQATGDLVKISKEQNTRGTPEGQALAYRLNEQNKALVDNVPLIREKAAPDVYSTRTIESSEALIDAYKKLDADRSAQITSAYKKLEDANGGTFPVDGVQLAKNADALLSKKLKTNFVPPEIAADLKRFREGEPMTFEQFEALRTNLAAEIRKAERSGDGNRSMASSLVYQALEDLPLQGSAAQLKPLADTARGLAKSRFDALKKDPAYKAAVNETVPADKFFDKYVIRGVNKNVNTMVETLGRDSVGHQHIKAGTINWLSDKAGIVDGKGNFSQANYNKALKSLDDVRNYQEIFDPETQLQLKTLGNVANYTQFQPRGSYVNNSNTLVGYLANKAAGGAEALGNVAGLKFVGGYPVGTEARKFIRSRKEKAAVEKSLQPGAGSTLEDVKNKGK
jgi:hypothetical protein